jgi:hypothetical protein
VNPNKKPESMKVLIMKYKGTYRRVIANEASDFELKIFKAWESKLKDLGFFENYRLSKLYRPLFLELSDG